MSTSTRTGPLTDGRYDALAFGVIVCTLRLHRGWSQLDLARACERSQQWISLVEQGLYDAGPKQKTKEVLGHAFGLGIKAFDGLDGRVKSSARRIAFLGALGGGLDADSSLSPLLDRGLADVRAGRTEWWHTLESCGGHLAVEGCLRCAAGIEVFSM